MPPRALRAGEQLMVLRSTINRFACPGPGYARKKNDMTSKPLGTIARAGETCPESGVWQPVGYSATAPIANGNRMPPYDSKAVTWKLIQYA